MNNCKTSIIIPCYNISGHIGKCIESILSQTFSHFELLLLDDGSTDSTLNVCNEYREKDSRIQVFSHANKGVSFTRNRGIELAAGEYIMFIDGDDYIKKDYIEKLVAVAAEGTWPVCGMINVRNGNFKDNHHFFQLQRLYPEGFIQNENFLTILKYYSLSSPCARLYNRNLIIDAEIRFNERITYQEDLIFNLAYIKRIKKIQLIDYFGYYYIEHGNSSTGRFHQKFDHIQLLKNELQKLIHRKDDSIIIKEFIFHSVIRKMANVFHPESVKNESEKVNELTQLFHADYFSYIYDYIKASPVNFMLKTILRLKSPQLAFLYYNKIRFMKTRYNALKYIKSDLHRYGKPPTYPNIIKELLMGDHAFKFSFWMRMCKSNNKLLYPISRIMYWYYRNKYGLQIPHTMQIGYGLNLGHGINIVFHETAIIGNNCNIGHNVTIGSNHNQAATIGDNVYIGPNVCLVEDVQIGNNATIGAGAVVVKDVAENTTVAGNPAKLISTKNPGRFITNRYEN